MSAASRTPEGWPNRCPICGEAVTADPTLPPGDAPCPSCGCLIWFDPTWESQFDILVPEAYLADLGRCTKEEAIRQMLGSLVSTGAVPAEACEEAVESLLSREEMGSTGIGRGFALPHGKHPELKRPVACLARSNAGIDFDSLDRLPVHLLVLLLSPTDQPGNHLRALEMISRWLRAQEPMLP